MKGSGNLTSGEITARAESSMLWSKLAFLAFLGMIAALPFMSATLTVGRHFATPADAFYLATVALLGLALLTREIRFRWHPAYWILAGYLAAMAVSLLFSAQPSRSAFKLLTQVYLLSLPVLALNLVRSADALRRSLTVWLWVAGMLSGVGVITLLLYFTDPTNPLLEFTLHPKGTLPEGDYPRIDLTFTHAAMLGNWLTVSLLILLGAGALGWVKRPVFVLLLAAMLLSLFFSLTPGLLGVPVAIGVWQWLRLRRDRPLVARLWLAGGILGGLPFLVAAAVTPIIHPTAPFLIEVPGYGTLAPAARLTFWIAGWQNMIAAFPFGTGIGTDAIAVPFQNPAGHLYTLYDAHNVYLSLGVQTGLPGLAALALLIFYVARRTAALSFCRPAELVPLVLGLAWLDAFALQGLVGAFEDARFLWIILGLFLAGLAAARERDCRDSGTC